MTLHPDKTHLYVGVRPAFGIVSYRIEADGTLQQAGMAPLPGSPTHISTDLQGRYLFSASYSGNCASISPIGHDGVVTAPIQQIDGLTAPHSANIDPTNQLVLVPCLKEDRIRLFNLSPAGQLTPHAQEAVATAAGAGRVIWRSTTTTSSPTASMSWTVRWTCWPSRKTAATTP